MNDSGVTKPVRCNDCLHHYITYDIRFPYGCRALGFRSKQQPIKVVMDASSRHCQYFSLRNGK